MSGGVGAGVGGGVGGISPNESIEIMKSHTLEGEQIAEDMEGIRDHEQGTTELEYYNQPHIVETERHRGS